MLWRGDKLRDLGTLSGKRHSVAYGINDQGDIVGEAYNQDPEGNVTDSSAFIWSRGRMRDLNGMISRGSGWTLRSATSINDRGEIAGGAERQGVRHAFVLRP